MPISKRIQALKLRRQNKSYNEISKQLDVPKSTLSYWFSKQEFSSNIKHKLIKKSAEVWARNITNYNKLRSKKIRLQNTEAIVKSAKDIRSISVHELKLIGTSLYWAEGGRRGGRFEFTNSDPLMIKIIMKFLKIICLVKPNSVKVQLNLHDNARTREAKKFWQKITGIPSQNFYKVNFYKNISSQGKRKNRLPYGTIQLRVYNKKLINTILGWIEGINQQV